MNRAAIYARSSKDRADVSIDAQVRQLEALAAERNLVVVKTFEDSVERADDRDRPGLRALLLEMNRADRGWDTIIMLDTARLARQDQGFAFAFGQECEKRGVRVVYKLLPAADPIMEVVFRQLIGAFDMLHSLMSREKGLAGMAENVRQGHRAGGRAPFGYRLVHTATGATRDGAPVTKSRLEPSEDATRIGAYLRDRAGGMPRARASTCAGLSMAETSLIGIEWNALTYAGFTVWNVHAKRVKGGYVGGVKRRPREQWVMQPDTHPALITLAQAEAVLAQLEAVRRRRVRPTERTYLLAGLLVTPQGAPWHGDRGNYRVGKGRKIEAGRLERSVLEALGQGLQSEEIVADLLRRMRALAGGRDSAGELKAIEKSLAELTRNIDRVSGLLAETTAPQALLRSIEGWEAQRTALLDRQVALAAARDNAARLKAIRAADVRRLLKHLVDDLKEASRPALKDALARLVDRVELDPETFACTAHWRVLPPKRGDKLASPRGFDLIPPIVTRVPVAPNRRWIRRVA